MKRLLGIFGLLVCTSLRLEAAGEIDSLLRVLDRTVAHRAVYVGAKQVVLDSLKELRGKAASLDELYRLNDQLIDQYSTFVCDSSERYIHENLRLAQQLGNREYSYSTRLKLAYTYSVSGLFVQADREFRSIPFDSLPGYLKAVYCWNRIRYCENIIRYTDDTRFSGEYISEIDACRDTVMGLLPANSREYEKEKAVKLQNRGMAAESIEILRRVFRYETPGTHGYGMMCMGLARAYRLAGNPEMEKKYLIQSAIIDLRLAIKENEALLSLAVKLHGEGDVERAYRYVKVAVEDAMTYNSRFKNTVISRIYPIIEDSYLYDLERQQRNLRLSIGIMGVLAFLLIVALAFLRKQSVAVGRARENLKKMNEELVALNHDLDKANVVKERYVAYFMNQCGVYVNKLEDYRKTVSRKIKSGQIDELYQNSSRPFERELEDLYVNFDKAFLKLYPHFVDEFNTLLKPAEHFQPRQERLNTELRIFALMRLGITDVSQIAVFLHYTPQTIYNYKNKVKAKSVLSGERFDEEVSKLGSMSTF